MRTIIVSALCLISTPALAQDVLILHATPYWPDVEAKLTATGQFDSVTVWDAGAPLPLSSIIGYDAIIIVPDQNFHQDWAMTLVDYVNAGGGLVDTIFSRLHAFLNPVSALSPLQLSGSPYGFGLVTLGSTAPGSLMGTGVASFEQQNFYDGNAALVPGATLDLSLSSGAPLAAHWAPTGAGTVVALNMFPPSSDIRSDLWNSSTDGAMIMANALLLAAGELTPPYGLDITGTCPGAVTISATGGTPSGAYAVASGTGPGSFTVRSGACAGTVIPLAGPALRFTGTFDGTGSFTRTPTIASGAACGKPVAVLDLTTCAVAATSLP